MKRHDKEWWRRAVIYEIALISFQDSNDGKGDLPGLVRRLEYLEWLGVDAIWLTPIYCSPMLDFGYDITDFCAIDPLFGAMADFDRLLSARSKAKPTSRNKRWERAAPDQNKGADHSTQRGRGEKARATRPGQQGPGKYKLDI